MATFEEMAEQMKHMSPEEIALVVSRLQRGELVLNDAGRQRQDERMQDQPAIEGRPRRVSADGGRSDGSRHVDDGRSNRGRVEDDSRRSNRDRRDNDERSDRNRRNDDTRSGGGRRDDDGRSDRGRQSDQRSDRGRGDDRRLDRGRDRDNPRADRGRLEDGRRSDRGRSSDDRRSNRGQSNDNRRSDRATGTPDRRGDQRSDRSRGDNERSNRGRGGDDQRTDNRARNGDNPRADRRREVARRSDRGRSDDDRRSDRGRSEDNRRSGRGRSDDDRSSDWDRRGDDRRSDRDRHREDERSTRGRSCDEQSSDRERYEEESGQNWMQEGELQLESLDDHLQREQALMGSHDPQVQQQLLQRQWQMQQSLLEQQALLQDPLQQQMLLYQMQQQQALYLGQQQQMMYGSGGVVNEDILREQLLQARLRRELEAAKLEEQKRSLLAGSMMGMIDDGAKPGPTDSSDKDQPSNVPLEQVLPAHLLGDVSQFKQQLQQSTAEVDPSELLARLERQLKEQQQSTQQSGVLAGQSGATHLLEGQPGVSQLQQGQTGVSQPLAGQAGVAQLLQGQSVVPQLLEGQAGVSQLLEGQAGVSQLLQGQAVVSQLLQGQSGVSQLLQGQAGVSQSLQGQSDVSQLLQGQAGVPQLLQGQSMDVTPTTMSSVTEGQMASVSEAGPSLSSVAHPSVSEAVSISSVFPKHLLPESSTAPSSISMMSLPQMSSVHQEPQATMQSNATLSSLSMTALPQTVSSSHQQDETIMQPESNTTSSLLSITPSPHTIPSLHQYPQTIMQPESSVMQPESSATPPSLSKMLLPQSVSSVPQQPQAIVQPASAGSSIEAYSQVIDPVSSEGAAIMAPIGEEDSKGTQDKPTEVPTSQSSDVYHPDQPTEEPTPHRDNNPTTHSYGFYLQDTVGLKEEHYQDYFSQFGPVLNVIDKFSYAFVEIDNLTAAQAHKLVGFLDINGIRVSVDTPVKTAADEDDEDMSHEDQSAAETAPEPAEQPMDTNIPTPGPAPTEQPMDTVIAVSSEENQTEAAPSPSTSESQTSESETEDVQVIDIRTPSQSSAERKKSRSSGKESSSPSVEERRKSKSSGKKSSSPSVETKKKSKSSGKDSSRKSRSGSVEARKKSRSSGKDSSSPSVAERKKSKSPSKHSSSKRRSRSPRSRSGSVEARKKSRTSGKDSSSPSVAERRKSKSPSKHSSSRRRSRSPRSRSGSVEARKKSKSSGKDSSSSSIAERLYSRSPSRRRSRSPKKRSRSPRRKQSPSARSRLKKSRSKSPRRRARSKSPRKRTRSRSPRKRSRTKSPRKRTRSRSPRKKSRSRSLKRKSRSRSPQRRSRSPRRRSRSPKKRTHRSHSRSHTPSDKTKQEDVLSDNNKEDQRAGDVSEPIQEPQSATTSNQTKPNPLTSRPIIEAPEKKSIQINLQKDADPNKWKCHVCNVTCKAEWSWKLHIKGALHKNQIKGNILKLKEGSKKRKRDDENQFHCKVCDVTCDDQTSYDAHLITTSHEVTVKMKEEEDEKKDKEALENTPSAELASFRLHCGNKFTHAELLAFVKQFGIVKELKMSGTNVPWCQVEFVNMTDYEQRKFERMHKMQGVPFQVDRAKATTEKVPSTEPGPSFRLHCLDWFSEEELRGYLKQFGVVKQLTMNSTNIPWCQVEFEKINDFEQDLFEKNAHKCKGLRFQVERIHKGTIEQDSAPTPVPAGEMETSTKRCDICYMSFKDQAKLDAHMTSVGHKIAKVRWMEMGGKTEPDSPEGKVEYVTDARKGPMSKTQDLYQPLQCLKCTQFHTGEHKCADDEQQSDRSSQWKYHLTNVDGLTEDDLREYFVTFGPLAEVAIVRNANRKWYGFVMFEVEAKVVGEHNIRGRWVEVELSVNNKDQPSTSGAADPQAAPIDGAPVHPHLGMLPPQQYAAPLLPQQLPAPAFLHPAMALAGPVPHAPMGSSPPLMGYGNTQQPNPMGSNAYMMQDTMQSLLVQGSQAGSTDDMEIEPESQPLPPGMEDQAASDDDEEVDLLSAGDIEEMLDEDFSSAYDYYYRNDWYIPSGQHQQWMIQKSEVMYEPPAKMARSDTASKSRKPLPQSQNRTVLFVFGFPNTITRADLQKHFRQFGLVKNVDMVKKRGYANVVFASPDAALAAYSGGVLVENYSQHTMDGQHNMKGVIVRCKLRSEAEIKSMQETEDRTLYLTGLRRVTIQKVKVHFSSLYGPVVKVLECPGSQNNIGFLEFQYPHDAAKAYQCGEVYGGDTSQRRHYIGDRFVTVKQRGKGREEGRRREKEIQKKDVSKSQNKNEPTSKKSQANVMELNWATLLLGGLNHDNADEILSYLRSNYGPVTDFKFTDWKMNARVNCGFLKFKSIADAEKAWQGGKESRTIPNERHHTIGKTVITVIKDKINTDHEGEEVIEAGTLCVCGRIKNLSEDKIKAYFSSNYGPVDEIRYRYKGFNLSGHLKFKNICDAEKAWQGGEETEKGDQRQRRYNIGGQIVHVARLKMEDTLLVRGLQVVSADKVKAYFSSKFGPVHEFPFQDPSTRMPPSDAFVKFKNISSQRRLWRDADVQSSDPFTIKYIRVGENHITVQKEGIGEKVSKEKEEHTSITDDEAGPGSIPTGEFMWIEGIVSIGKQDIKRHFSQYGEVKDIQKYQKNQRYGFIQFASVDQAETAFKKGTGQQARIRNHRIRIVRKSGGKDRIKVTVRYKDPAREKDLKTLIQSYSTTGFKKTSVVDQSDRSSQWKYHLTNIEGLTEDDLSEYFVKFGPLAEVAIIPTKGKWYGFVTFEKFSEEQESQVVGDHKIRGKWVNVALSVSKSKKKDVEEQCDKSSQWKYHLTHIEGLVEDDLREYFAKFGLLAGVAIVQRSTTCFGFVTFEKFSEEQESKLVGDHKIRGKYVNVFPSDKNKPSSTRPRETASSSQVQQQQPVTAPSTEPGPSFRLHCGDKFSELELRGYLKQFGVVQQLTMSSGNQPWCQVEFENLSDKAQRKFKRIHKMHGVTFQVDRANYAPIEKPSFTRPRETASSLQVPKQQPVSISKLVINEGKESLSDSTYTAYFSKWGEIERIERPSHNQVVLIYATADAAETAYFAGERIGNLIRRRHDIGENFVQVKVGNQEQKRVDEEKADEKKDQYHVIQSDRSSQWKYHLTNIEGLTEDDLSEYFVTFGPLAEVAIIRKPKWKWYGFVTFVKFSEEQESQVVGDHKVRGKWVNVAPSVKSKKKDVHVEQSDKSSQWEYHLTHIEGLVEDDLREYFAKFGPLAGVAIVQRSTTCFGFVTFEKFSEEQESKLVGDHKIRGKYVNVFPSDKNKPSSTRPRETASSSQVQQQQPVTAPSTEPGPSFRLHCGDKFSELELRGYLKQFGVVQQLTMSSGNQPWCQVEFENLSDKAQRKFKRIHKMHGVTFQVDRANYAPIEKPSFTRPRETASSLQVPKQQPVSISKLVINEGKESLSDSTYTAYFSKWGEIERIERPSHNQVVLIYATADAAETAYFAGERIGNLIRRRHDIGENFVQVKVGNQEQKRVDEEKADEKKDQYHVIQSDRSSQWKYHLTNIEDLTEDDLSEYFVTFGPLAEVAIIRKPNRKWYGFVTFVKFSEEQESQVVGDHKVRGKWVNVAPSVKSKKKDVHVEQSDKSSQWEYHLTHIEGLVEDDLREYFAKFGPLAGVAIVQRSTTCFGFVTFEKFSEEQESKLVGDHKIRGKYVNVFPSDNNKRKGSQEEAVPTLFIYGFQRGGRRVPEEDLRDYFNKFGKLKTLNVLKDKGYGFVYYGKLSSYTAALNAGRMDDNGISHHTVKGFEFLCKDANDKDRKEQAKSSSDSAMHSDPVMHSPSIQHHFKGSMHQAQESDSYRTESEPLMDHNQPADSYTLQSEPLMYQNQASDSYTTQSKPWEQTDMKKDVEQSDQSSLWKYHLTNVEHLIKDDLSMYFAKFGHLTSVAIIQKRSREWYGFVTFENFSEEQESELLREHKIRGKYVNVFPSGKNKRKNDSKTKNEKTSKGSQEEIVPTLFICRFGQKLTEEDLHDHFEKFGKLKRMNIFKSKAYGFVDYGNLSSFNAAFNAGIIDEGISHLTVKGVEFECMLSTHTNCKDLNLRPSETQILAPVNQEKLPRKFFCYYMVEVQHLTGRDLRDYFSHLGTVVEARTSNDARTDSLKRPYGHVKFEWLSKEDEQRLLWRMHTIKGVEVMVQRSKPKELKGTKQFHLKGIQDLTAIDVDKYFSKFGQLVEVKLMTRREGMNINNPYGFIEYVDLTDEEEGDVLGQHAINDVCVTVGHGRREKQAESSSDSAMHSDPVMHSPKMQPPFKGSMHQAQASDSYRTESEPLMYQNQPADSYMAQSEPSIDHNQPPDSYTLQSEPLMYQNQASDSYTAQSKPWKQTDMSDKSSQWKYYLTNIDGLTEDDLGEYFAKFGPLAEVTITRRRKKWYGFVTFETFSKEQESQLLGEHNIRGEYVMVSPTLQKKSDRSSQWKYHLTNVDGLTEDDLREYFVTFGPLAEVAIVRNSNRKWYGFVMFEVEAKVVGEHNIRGRWVEVELSVNNKKKVEEKSDESSPWKYHLNRIEDLTEDEITEYFVQFGSVAGVDIIRNANRPAYGFVIFEKFSEEQESQVVGDHNIRGRLVSVVPSASNKKKDVEEQSDKSSQWKYHLTHIEGLTDSDLSKYFAQFGPIAYVDIIPHTVRPWYGFVKFEKFSDEQESQLVGEHQIRGKYVHVVPSDKNKRKDENTSKGSQQEAVPTLFIYRFGKLLSELDLRNYFKQFGKLKKMNIIKDKGFGFVDYTKLSSFNAAFNAGTVDMGISHYTLKGVNFEGKEKDDPTRKPILFIYGFGQRLVEQDLGDYFRKFGKIEKININESKSYGFVYYAKSSSFMAAFNAGIIDEGISHHTLKGVRFHCKDSTHQARQAEGPKGSKRFHLSGLKNLTTIDIDLYFSKFGQIVDVKLAGTQQPDNPFGFIQYVDLTDQEELDVLGKHVINNVWVTVERARQGQAEPLSVSAARLDPSMHSPKMQPPFKGLVHQAQSSDSSRRVSEPLMYQNQASNSYTTQSEPWKQTHMDAWNQNTEVRSASISSTTDNRIAEVSEEVAEEVDSIVLSKISNGLTEDDMRSYFKAFGQIKELKVMQTKKHGFGFVRFTTQKAADKALRAGEDVEGPSGVSRIYVKGFSFHCEREIDSAEIEEKEKDLKKAMMAAHKDDNKLLSPSKLPIWCSVCECWTTSEKDFKAHSDGNSHKQKIQIWQEKRTRRTVEKLCELCELVLPNAELYQDHLQSWMHVSNTNSKGVVRKGPRCMICKLDFSSQQVYKLHLDQNKEKHRQMQVAAAIVAAGGTKLPDVESVEGAGSSGGLSRGSEGTSLAFSPDPAKWMQQQGQRSTTVSSTGQSSRQMEPVGGQASGQTGQQTDTKAKSAYQLKREQVTEQFEWSIPDILKENPNWSGEVKGTEFVKPGFNCKVCCKFCEWNKAIEGTLSTSRSNHCAGEEHRYRDTMTYQVGGISGTIPGVFCDVCQEFFGFDESQFADIIADHCVSLNHHLHIKLYRLKNNMKLPKWLQKPPFEQKLGVKPSQEASTTPQSSNYPHTSAAPSLFDVAIDTSRVDGSQDHSGETTDEIKQYLHDNVHASGRRTSDGMGYSSFKR